MYVRAAMEKTWARSSHTLIGPGSETISPRNLTVTRLSDGFVVLVLVVSCIGAYAPPFPWGFILSPSATLQVAGLDLFWPMARG